MEKYGASDQIAIVDPDGVMCQHVERPIARLNLAHRSSLKAGGYVAHYYSSSNHFKKDLITAVRKKSYNGLD